MADERTVTTTLKVELAFVDGDSRTQTVKNPISDDEELAEKLAELNTFIQTDNLLIGDKDDGTFGKIRSAKRVIKDITNLDI